MQPDIKPKQRVKILYGEVEHGGAVEHGEVFSVNTDGSVTIRLDDGEDDHYFAISFDWNEQDKQWVVDLR